jgi:hypothetical protein
MLNVIEFTFKYIKIAPVSKLKHHKGKNELYLYEYMFTIKKEAKNEH